jgi:hypothetical protein
VGGGGRRFVRGVVSGDMSVGTLISPLTTPRTFVPISFHNPADRQGKIVEKNVGWSATPLILHFILDFFYLVPCIPVVLVVILCSFFATSNPLSFDAFGVSI